MGLGEAKVWLKASIKLLLLTGISKYSFAQSPTRRPLKTANSQASQREQLSPSDEQALNNVGPSHFATNEDYESFRNAKDPYKKKIETIKKNPQQYLGPYLNLQFGIESALQNIPRNTLDSLVISYASGIIRNVHKPEIQREGNTGDKLTLVMKLLLGNGDVHFNQGEMSLAGKLLARDDFKENLGHILEALDLAFPSEDEALKKIKEIVPEAKRKFPLLPDFTSPAEIHEALDTASINIFNNLAYIMVYAKLQEIQKNSPAFASLKFDEEKLQDFILELSDHKKGQQAPVEFPFFSDAQSHNLQKLDGTYAECMGRSMGVLAKIECLNSFVTAASYPALKMVVGEMAEQKFNEFADSEILPELLRSGLQEHLVDTFDAEEQKHSIMNFADHVSNGIITEQIEKLRKAIVLPEETPPDEIQIRNEGLDQLQAALNTVLAQSKIEIEEKGKGKTVTSFIDSVLVAAHSDSPVSPSDEIILKNIESFHQEGPVQDQIKLFVASLLLNSESYEQYKALLENDFQKAPNFLLRFEAQLQETLRNPSISPKHGQEGLSAYLDRLLNSKENEPSIINEVVGEMSSLITYELTLQFDALERGEPNNFPIHYRPEIEQTLDLLRVAHSIEDFSYEKNTISCRKNNRQMLGVLKEDLRSNGGKSFSENPTQFAAKYIQMQEKENVSPSLIDCVIMGYAQLGTLDNVVRPLETFRASMADGPFQEAIAPLIEGTQASLEPENIFRYLRHSKSTAHSLKAELTKDLYHTFDPKTAEERNGLATVIRTHIPRLISDALSSSFSTQNFQKGLFTSTQTLQDKAYQADQENENLNRRFPHLNAEKYDRLYDELRACSEMYMHFYMKQFTPLIEHAAKASIDQILSRGVQPGTPAPFSLVGALIDIDTFSSIDPDNPIQHQSEAATKMQSDFAKSAQETYAGTTLSPEMRMERQGSATGLSSLLYELFVYQNLKEQVYKDESWKSLLDLIDLESDFNKKDYFFTFNDAYVRNPKGASGSFLDQGTKGAILLKETLRNALAPSSKIANLANFVAGLENQKSPETQGFKDFLNNSCADGSAFLWESDLSLEQIFHVWKSQKESAYAEESLSSANATPLRSSTNGAKH